MDIFSQYKKEHLEESRVEKQTPTIDEYGRAYTGMIAFVIGLSGGRIRDARQASYMLLGIAGFILFVSLWVLFFAGGSHSVTPPGRIINEAGTPPRLETPLLLK